MSVKHTAPQVSKCSQGVILPKHIMITSSMYYLLLFYLVSLFVISFIYFPLQRVACCSVHVSRPTECCNGRLVCHVTVNSIYSRARGDSFRNFWRRQCERSFVKVIEKVKAFIAKLKRS